MKTDKSAATIRRLHTQYDHPHSRKQRQLPRAPDEADHVKRQWDDAKQAAADKSRARRGELERTIRQEQASDSKYHAGRGDDVYVRLRKEDVAKSQEELKAVDQMYASKYEAAAKRNPIE